MKINEFIVVEGKDDTERVKSAVDCDTIETNGSAIDTYTLEVIQHAQQTRGVIVLTDPDFPGDKIRNTIKDIQEALMHVSSPLEEAKETIDKSVLIDLGLIIGKDARYRRNILGRKLHIGHSNGKQLLKKLNAFGYTEDDVRKALFEEEEN